MTATLTAVTDTHATFGATAYPYIPDVAWILARNIGRELEVVIVKGTITHAAIPSASVFCPRCSSATARDAAGETATGST